ncbi:MAG: ABC transporter substrate-binding protein [Anaerolineales bacterium]|nr:ABC transporter substrate-binding protein [Anaerolineales bacterium]
MRKLALLLTTILLVLSLVPSLPTTQAQDKIEISFVHIFTDENDIRGQVVAELINEFNASHSNIVVTAQAITTSYDEVLTTTLLAADQNDAPHVVQLDESATRFAVDSEKFLAIEDIATDEQKATFDDILPVVREFYTVDSKLWSLPWNSSNPLLYYNKTMFEAAGLDPNNPPHTFDEVLATCEALMAADLGLSGCINWPLTAWFPENWVAMQGALLADNENGHTGRPEEVFFNSPEMLRVFEWWNTLADNGYYAYTGKLADYNGEGGAFITRRFAMHINSTAGLSNFQHYAGVLKYDLGVAPLPIPDENATNGTVNGGASLWITAGHSDAETEAAREFVFFMTNTENIARWHEATGYFPNRQSSIDSIEASGFWEENPNYYITVQQLLGTQAIPATAGTIVGPSLEIRNILAEAVQSMIDQGVSPEDALAAADQLADLEIEDYNFFYAE